MNWEMVAAVAAVLGILTTIICVVFLAGKLTQQIADSKIQHEKHVAEVSEKFDEQDAKIADHADRLSSHDVEIALLKQWKDGYNAAAAIAQNRDHASGQ